MRYESRGAGRHLRSFFGMRRGLGGGRLVAGNHTTPTPPPTPTAPTLSLALLYLLFVAIFLRNREPGFIFKAFGVASPFIGFVWIAFLICYLMKCSRLIRGGLCVMLFGVAAFLSEFIVNKILGLAAAMPEFHPSLWNAATVDGNVTWVILIGSIVIGLILAGIGLVRDNIK